MKKRNFTEKSKTVRNKFATEMVDKALAKFERPMMESTILELEWQYHWGSEDCVAYDEDGNELNDGEFDRTIAEEIAEEILYDGFYDNFHNYIELPSRTEMIENLLEDLKFVGVNKEIKEETWSDTFERMIRHYDTGIGDYLD